jgi:hypothetical protein
MWDAELHGGVALLIYSRPPDNVIGFADLAELDEALLRWAGDDRARVIVLTGGLPGYFIAHADLARARGRHRAVWAGRVGACSQPDLGCSATSHRGRERAGLGRWVRGRPQLPDAGGVTSGHLPLRRSGRRGHPRRRRHPAATAADRSAQSGPPDPRRRGDRSRPGISPGGDRGGAARGAVPRRRTQLDRAARRAAAPFTGGRQTRTRPGRQPASRSGPRTRAGHLPPPAAIPGDNSAAGQARPLTLSPRIHAERHSSD